jgi:hypothetical protein
MEILDYLGKAELDTFSSISLEELKQVSLFNRIDTKYIVQMAEFAGILKEIQSNYRVLQVENKRIHRYESLYFDTPDFKLYHYHHNEKQNRFKVRYRKYVDSGLCYFEIKYKQNNNRTHKERELRSQMNDLLQPEDIQMIRHDSIRGHSLEKKMMVYFNRVTLANNSLTERITLDTNLQFDNGQQKRKFPNLLICEIKQNKTDYTSPILKACNRRHYEQIGFSKYSTAIALMERVKSNNFKPSFIKINKLIHE